MEYNINADIVSVKASKVVQINEYFSLMTTNGVIDLKVDISADF
jgi:hypothetical protein